MGSPLYVPWILLFIKTLTLTPEVHVKFDDKVKGRDLFRADYHWNFLIGIPSNWDFYAAARAGLNFAHDLQPDLGIQVGGRWYWSKKWGMDLELAGGLVLEQLSDLV